MYSYRHFLNGALFCVLSSILFSCGSSVNGLYTANADCTIEEDLRLSFVALQIKKSGNYIYTRHYSCEENGQIVPCGRGLQEGPWQMNGDSLILDLSEFKETSVALLPTRSKTLIGSQELCGATLKKKGLFSKGAKTYGSEGSTNY